jgi:hypothetical protein
MDDIKTLASWLWGLLVPVVFWVWNKQDKRIDTIEGSMVSRSALAERKIEVDRELDERRLGERQLHERINEHILEDTKIHTVMLDKLAEIKADVAFIRGHLDR